MQIFSGEECFLIDPLSEKLDITLIFPLLENQSIQKVAFSFSEDIRLLHHIGCKPKGIYDVSTTASFLNHPPTSLTNLLDEVLDIQVGKSSQQSNWFNRPLSENQLEYAASDVLHLIDLQTVLHAQAKKVGILDWIDQENTHFESADYSNEGHSTFLKEKDKGDLSELQWHILTRLMEFREETAKRLHKPGYKLIDKKYLTEVAENPNRIKAWKNINSTYKKLKDEIFEKLITEVLESALEEADSLNLSSTKKAANSFSREEYLLFKKSQRKVEKAKIAVFKPIQEALEKDFGKSTQTFILNNRLIKDYVEGNFDNYLPYKKELIEGYAKKLDLPLFDL